MGRENVGQVKRSQSILHLKKNDIVYGDYVFQTSLAILLPYIIYLLRLSLLFW